VFDPLSFADERDRASLSDVLVIELVARFLQHIENEMADDMSAATWSALCEIEQIRPLLLIPAAMEAMLERTATPVVRNRIKRIWDYMVEQVLHLEIVRQMTATCSVDVIDGLAAALKFARRDTHNWIGRTLNFVNSLRGAASTSYAPQAIAEADFRNRRARHIVYGHTHQPETVPLDASHADGYVLTQTYFNAGCCRRSYQPMQMLTGSHELAACDTFSLLCFYQGDERSGRTHESWCGTLAPMTAEIGGQEMPAVGTTTTTHAPARMRAPQFTGATRTAASRTY
jgi:hypothetical protein